mmetsp:Transcript_39597/g.63532  ORF Transcript_39597/g.63532 Transcript_39597/m.63532 type:complete len:483 (+) Transcript_39597:1-1449(+)
MTSKSPLQTRFRHLVAWVRSKTISVVPARRSSRIALYLAAGLVLLTVFIHLKLNDIPSFHWGISVDLKEFPKGWLNINTSRISVGGHSNSADFAHQLHVAFSKTISGVCMFAGAPYHCAVTRFAADTLIDEAGGARGSVPFCEGCPIGKTLIYDKCKSKPWAVDVGMLPDYPRRVCRERGVPNDGCLDDVDNLRKPHQRVYLQRGLRDKCYLSGSVANVHAFYAQMMDDPGNQILFNNSLDLPHTIPKPGMFKEAMAYDGPGECVTHTLKDGLPLNSRALPVAGNTFKFDQTRFSGYDPSVGWHDFGWLYVPKSCQNAPLHTFIPDRRLENEEGLKQGASQEAKDHPEDATERRGGGAERVCNANGIDREHMQSGKSSEGNNTNNNPCALMIWLKPCGGGGDPRGTSFDGFEEIAERNRIIIMTPVLKPNSCYLKFWKGCHEVARGCWDAYGQTGANYALQSGAHMRPVGEMVKDLLASSCT